MMTKNTHNFIIPNNIHFSETPKIIEIQNFEPLKMVTYIHENIRAFSCKGGGGGQSDRLAEDWHADRQAYWQADRYMYTC